MGDGFDVLNAVAFGDGGAGGCLAARGGGGGEICLERGEVGLEGFQVLSLKGDGARKLAFPYCEVRDASVELA